MFHDYLQEYRIKPDDIIVYLRKSRSDDPLLTVEEVLARHEAIVDEWAEKNLGVCVPSQNKFREVVSGETIEDRPEIQKILEMIESPKYKAILIVEVQRLSRGDLEDCGRLMKLLRYTNTLIITPQKIYDLQDEYDRDIFERELKRGNEYLEYTKRIMDRGRIRSVSEGNYIGSRPPYGYDRIFVTEGKRKYPTLRINEEEANIVRMIFDMYVNQDLGRHIIAKQLDSMGVKPPRGEYWSAASLRNMLENAHYIGKVVWNWRKSVTIVENGNIRITKPKAREGEYLIYDGKHEPIISEELFYAAKEKQGRNTRVKPTTKIRNPLAGLVYCRCGRSMTYRTYTSHEGQPRLLCINQTHCHTGSCTYEEMLKMVRNTLIECIEDFEYKIEISTGDTMVLHEKLLHNLEKRMQDIEARELAQWESQAHPDPSQRMPAEIFKTLNERLLKEKEEIREAIRTAKTSMPDSIDYGEVLVRFKAALEALDDPNVDAEKKNRLLKACIDRIYYSREAPIRLKRSPGEPSGSRFKSSGGKWSDPPINIDVKLRV